MTDLTSLVQEGFEHHQHGRLPQAAALYREVLKSQPRHAEANHLLGLLEHQSGRREAAIELLSEAASAEPDNAAYLSNLGVVQQSLGQLEDARDSYQRAITLDATIAAVHSNLGVVLQGLGQFEAALAELRIALGLEPAYAEANANLGLTLHSLGRHEEAIAAFRRAITLRPRYAKAHGGLGSALKELGQIEAAIESYRAAIAIQPLDAGVHNNLALALRDAGRLEGALESYQKAVALRPDYAEARYNLGRLLSDIGREEEAIDSYREALSIRETAATHFGMGITLLEIDRLEEATAAFLRAVEIDPGDGRARSKYWRTRSHGCDWQDFDTLCSEVRAIVTGFELQSGKEPVSPFPTLGVLDDPALHLRAAMNRASALLRRTATEPGASITRPSMRPARDKIRLAYLSADFHDHATAYLIAELFEQHDRDRFEVHGVSFGPADDSPMRRRIESAFAGFHDVREQSSQSIAQTVADLGIDIAVDLKGYTQEAKTGVFVHRPAPIQVQYLGYPGTMGADFIDYIIADPIVIPEAERIHYKEKIAYLPHSYQVNDRRRPLPASGPSRRDCGLPEVGFVFASFNANYKITPEVFSVWMRLLQKVEGSVLWLFESNSWATQNLRAEAAARGVDPERLVFGQRQPLDQHLARVRNADLFLDTLPYNAHTTASDALWVGLPVVTVAGRSFAARVAASLLTAVGLPELITTSLAQYETLALALARSPQRLAELGRKLENNRGTAPLFDTPAFARHLEAAYVTMWQRHLEGKAPETFQVQAS